MEDKEGIEDRTQTNLINLRRVIYLTIMNALNYEEAVHKLLKVQIKEGQEVSFLYPRFVCSGLGSRFPQIELCKMIIECCSQERSYSTFYGLIGERFCRLNRVWFDCFEEAFREYYETIHRYETNRLRNIARFFGHLIASDAVSWNVLDCIKLTEEETTSSSRIFIKIMFNEVSESMGLKTVAERFKDPEVRMSCRGMFPLDNPKDTRFSINYFTSIGLGAITEDMREHLKVCPSSLLPKSGRHHSPLRYPECPSSDHGAASRHARSRILVFRQRLGLGLRLVQLGFRFGLGLLRGFSSRQPQASFAVSRSQR